MKHRYLFFIFAFIFQTITYSQPCLPDGITFTNQAEIDNFQANYPNCTEIGGDLIVGGDDITNLLGLNVITKVGGELVIGYHPNPGGVIGAPNPNLTSLLGLESLTAVSGPICIAANDLIQDLSGLENLDSCGGSLLIGGNQALQDLTGLTSLGFSGSIRIRSNESLTTLTGMTSLDTLEYDLEICCNNSLASLAGLENLIYAGGLDINGNVCLSSLSGLESLTKINGDLRIEYNDSLTDLTGLENLNSVSGDLIISDYFGGGHSKLVNLNGLNNLDSIGQRLAIFYLDSLISLESLENLAYVGGEIRIKYNTSLQSLSGLDNINPGTISLLDIIWNPNLSFCAVQSICNFLLEATGTANIWGNAPGCNSVSEVEEDCESLSVLENEINYKYSIYLNPASGEIFINCNNGSSIDMVSVYNQLGQLVLRVEGLRGNIDVSSLQRGIYIIEILSNKYRNRQKLLIE